jgi:diketogulonate reductase-like aldo/keto reductase
MSLSLTKFFCSPATVTSSASTLWSRQHTETYISCAWGYGNEGEVAVGIKASGVPREDIWITSKLFELHHRPEHVEMACRDSLKKLGTDYLDMYLMHYPVSSARVYKPG